MRYFFSLFAFLFLTASVPPGEPKVILFLGDSLSAGFGLEVHQAFPALVQHKIDSLGLNFKVINAGLTGETTSGGLRRADWLLKQKVDVLVLELGANDGLRGLSPEDTEKNLQTIIDKTKQKYPNVKIVLAGMQVPPNLGQDYTAKFKAIYPALAKKNKAVLVPFLLEGVGGIPRLNLPDGIHPTAEGHQIVAATIWKSLKPVLLAESK
jgi:acyl-CoA thioesterase-1